jgi:hypothetical protein
MYLLNPHGYGVDYGFSPLNLPVTMKACPNLVFLELDLSSSLLVGFLSSHCSGFDFFRLWTWLFCSKERWPRVMDVLRLRLIDRFLLLSSFIQQVGG